MPNFASRLALLACGLLFVSACGQRGPLYLPDNPPTTQAEKACPTCAAFVAEEEADRESEADESEDKDEIAPELTPDETTE